MVQRKNRLTNENKTIIFSKLIKVPPRYNQRPLSAKREEILNDTNITIVPEKIIMINIDIV